MSLSTQQSKEENGCHEMTPTINYSHKN